MERQSVLLLTARRTSYSLYSRGSKQREQSVFDAVTVPVEGGAAEHLTGDERGASGHVS